MKLAGALALSAVTACAAPYAPQRDDPTSDWRDNRLSFYLGQRNLDEDDYDPVDEQTVFGMEYARELEDSPVGFEAGLVASGDSGHLSGGVDVEGTTGEIYGGLRKSFGKGRLRPFAGVGIAYINSEVRLFGGPDVDDSSLAAYAHAGLAFDATQHFYFGLDLRFLFGSDLELAGIDTDADYGQLALVLGMGF